MSFATAGKGSRTPGAKPGSGGTKKPTPSATGKLSNRLNPKTIDPFANPKKAKSAFASVYTNGGIPCRLVHGSVKHKLAWEPPVEQVAFDPVLVTLAEGLKEKIHPYTFVAKMGFKELLEAPHACDQTVQILPKLMPPLRTTLSDSDPGVFDAGLDAVMQLSAVVGPALNTHLKVLLVPICKKLMDKKHRDKVTDLLHTLEQNGGKECTPILKSKAPTYMSIYM
ncbi:unnamed protein product [Owenia fusiformis]|uniref:PACRG-like protein n=1 Tax=Owenia fusiformis TaxID=6347 RepID=A0A8S4NQA4_OWEFU|nr:unnamed protein product [Owenia fusiformis]